MKKYLFVLLLVGFSMGQNIGYPYYLWTAIYASDWSIGNPKEAKYAEYIGLEFHTKLAEKIAASPYNGKTVVYNQLKRLRTDFNMTNWDTDPRQNSEFMIHAGHGSSGEISGYNFSSSFPLSPSETFRDYNKWIFFYQCKTLAAFGPNSIPNSSNGIIQSMRGAHGIFGFASNVYGAYNHPCGFLNLQSCEVSGHRIWDDFFQRWVINKEPMWNAWRNAAYSKLYVDMRTSGVAVAAVGAGAAGGPVGTSSMDGLRETIDKINRDPMPPAANMWHSYYSVYGNPTY